MENKLIIITIDGWSSCGKSTLAKQLANSLNYVYIDSGAMYRAITLYFLRNHVDWTKKKAVEEPLHNINLAPLERFGIFREHPDRWPGSFRAVQFCPHLYPTQPETDFAF